MTYLARLIPIGIAVLAIAALLLRIDIESVKVALKQGHVIAIVPWAIAFAIGNMALQVNWDRLLLSRTPVPPSYAKVWTGKAGTAVLNAVLHALGSGGYVAWVARATGVGVERAAALVVVIVLSDLAALTLVALVTMLSTDAAVPASLVAGAAVCFGSIAAFAIALRFLPIPQRYLRGERLRNVVTTIGDIPLTMWSIQILGRSLTMSFVIAVMSMGAIAFGLHIPLGVLFALMPVALLVQVLPVNVAGFGAAQAAFVVLFSSYDSEARLFAFHILWQFAASVFCVLRGLPFLKSTTQEIAKPNAKLARASVPEQRN